MTTAQAAALTTEQIVGLTTQQVVALETRDIASMTMTQVNAFENEDVQAMSSDQLAALFSVTPIVLDLDGNGIRTTAAAQGVNFDLTGTGNVSKVGWTAGGDGLLVMDRNHDGIINSGSELFGVGTILANGKHAANGYMAMAEMDVNHDGKLSALDTGFSDLRVWVDANHDGKTDAGELRLLTEYSIQDLSLNAAKGTEVDNGNLVGLVSSYTKTDGSQHVMADVWFSKAAEAAPEVKLSDLLVAPTADVLHGGASPAATTPAPTSHAVDNLFLAQRRLDEDDNKHLPLI